MAQNTVYYHGTRIVPESLEVIDIGGEGIIYRFNANMVIKLLHGWKSVGTPSNLLEIEERRRVDRIFGMQEKLKNLPNNIPEVVVKPLGLVYDNTRMVIVGLIMPFVEGFTLDQLANSKKFRRQFTMSEITKILLDTHRVIVDTHLGGVVFGDLTPENFIIQRIGRFFDIKPIDFDSMQWGKYRSDGFKWDWADPLHLGLLPSGEVSLVKPYTQDADWYSFTAITMLVLTRINPYEGTIDMKAEKKWKINDSKTRPLKRLNVFHPDVVYPTAGTPLVRFPSEIVNFWKDTFVKDKRGIFPPQLLMQLKWQTCSKCQTVYASNVCTHK